MALCNTLAEKRVGAACRVRWLARNWNALDNWLDAIPEAGATQNTVGAFLNRLADKCGHRESFVGGGGVHALLEHRLKPHALR